MSDPLLTNLHTSLMDFTEWQHSTLRVALNSHVRSAQHGTNPPVVNFNLTTTNSDGCCESTIFCFFSRRYSGYPSCPVCVSFRRYHGNLFVHLLSFKHGELGVILPQGPCTICVLTVLNRSGSISASGSSALMKSSTLCT